MSNSWIPSNSEGEQTDFDLFAPNTEDNLREVLAKGSYKWTNKFTAIFAAILLIVSSASAGIWYGHRSASSAGTGLSASGSFSRSGFTRSSFGGSATGASGSSGAAAFGGGGFGGSRVSGTVASVKGSTITVTADSDPSSTVKTGDSVSVRVSGGGAVPQTAPQSPTQTTASTTKTKSSGTSSGTAAGTPSATPRPQVSGGSGRGGGFTSNPDFVACLKKNGVTVVEGQRLDRNDPKVSAALQACFSTLGGGFGGGQRPNGSASAGTPPTP
jgi:hypothetical protein